MRHINIFSYNEWDGILSKSCSLKRIIRLLISGEEVGIINKYGEVSAYAQLDEVGNIKYVHQDLVKS